MAVNKEVLTSRMMEAPNVDNVKLYTPEFTSHCPVTRLPDYATITIEYTPARFIVEIDALRTYLASYRNEYATGEQLAAHIADDLNEAIQPKHIRVIVQHASRETITVTATATRPNGE